MALFGRSEDALLRRSKKLEHGIPSRDVLSSLFRFFDPESLPQALVRLAADRAGRLGPQRTLSRAEAESNPGRLSSLGLGAANFRDDRGAPVRSSESVTISA